MHGSSEVVRCRQGRQGRQGPQGRQGRQGRQGSSAEIGQLLLPSLYIYVLAKWFHRSLDL